MGSPDWPSPPGGARTCPLLDHVGRLVGRLVQVGLPTQRDVLAEGIRALCTHRVRGGAGLGSRVGPQPAYVVPAEGSLNLPQKWQGLAVVGGAAGGGLVQGTPLL